MREIKFRVWDIKGKKMVNPIYFCTFHMSKEVQELHGYDANTGWKTPQPFRLLTNEVGPLLPIEDNFILLLYTGLKDKKGEEIYEGDIWEISKWDDDTKTNIPRPAWLRGEVRYGSGAFRIHGYILCELASGGIIIGNKYENPELSDSNMV